MLASTHREERFFTHRLFEDRLRFEKEYPQWRIRDIRRHTHFRYLLSGGVSMRGSMRGRLFEFWQCIEDCLGAVMKYLAMFATIVLIRSSVENSIHEKSL